MLEINIPGLYGGISQQIPELRLPHQGEDILNTRSSPIIGLQLKRPPTKLEKVLTDSIGASTCYINKLTTSYGTYALVVTADTKAPIRIFRLDDGHVGEEIEDIDYILDGASSPLTYVNYGSGVYPYQKHKSRSMLDKTYLINNQMTVAKLTTRTTTSPQPCFSAIWVKRDLYEATTEAEGGAFNHVYNFTFKYQTVNTTTNTVTSGTYSDSVTTAQEGSEAIAEAIEDKLSDYLIANSLDAIIGVGSDKSVVYLRTASVNTGTNFSVEISDTFGNTLMSCINSTTFDEENTYVTVASGAGAGDYGSNFVGQVQKTADLFPYMPSALSSLAIRVASLSNKDIGYYLEYDDTSQLYKETIAPYILKSIDKRTLPVEIIALSATAFVVSFFSTDIASIDPSDLSSCSYLLADREVGDDDSNSFPSMVGHYVTDMFIMQNRLGLLAGDSVIMSRTYDYYTFFVDTATDVLETDTIDIAASVNEYTVLTDAVLFESGIHIFDHDKFQFLLHSGGVALTPTTVQLEFATSYKRKSSVVPANKGNSVFFPEQPTLAGGYINMREYELSTDGLTKTASRLTTHVPKFIDDCDFITPMDTSDIMVVGKRNSENLFVLEYQISYGDNGVPYYAQQAWTKWNIDGFRIFKTFQVDNKLYLVGNYSGYDVIMSMLMENENQFPLTPFVFHIDAAVRLSSGEGSYDSTGDYTEYDPIPFAHSNTTLAGCLLIHESTGREVLHDGMTNVLGKLRVAGVDLSSKNVIFGIPFESKFVLSEQMLKDSQNNSRRSLLDPVVTTLYIRYSSCGHLNVSIENVKRPTVAAIEREYYPHTNLGGSFIASEDSEVLISQVRATEKIPGISIPLEDFKVTLSSYGTHFPCTINSIGLNVIVKQK